MWLKVLGYLAESPNLLHGIMNLEWWPFDLLWKDDIQCSWSSSGSCLPRGWSERTSLNSNDLKYLFPERRSLFYRTLVQQAEVFVFVTHSISFCYPNIPIPLEYCKKGAGINGVISVYNTGATGRQAAWTPGSSTYQNPRLYKEEKGVINPEYE